MAQLETGDLVRRLEYEYVNGETVLSKYVSFSQYENIEKIDAYLNSKHTSGLYDSLEREKPFFNIITGAVNIWYRATDIDRKNIRIKATKTQDYIPAFLATIHLQEWMRREGFGVVLNEWGRSLARYGSSVLKFIEKGGRLHVEVVSWNRLISDTVDFKNNPKIEKLYLTPAQLRANKAYDQDKVAELINALESRETIDGEKKDNQNNYVEVYELHGELPLSLITEKEKDEETYAQQMHVISFVKSTESDDYDDFCLLKGREAKDPYLITHLIKEDGRSQAIGAVEHLFEAQWMVNYTAKQIKDQLDLASKIIFQTADGSFATKNALLDIEVGDILTYEGDKELSRVDNSGTDITALQNFGGQWQLLAKEITSTPDSISGNTMPSGTAYRQVAILNQESHSLFEIMTENKGLAIEEMMRIYVIPFLKKKMDTTKEITATLNAHDVAQFDSMYVPNEAIRRHNAKLVYEALNNPIGKPAEGLDINQEQGKIQQQLSQLGNQRFIKPSDISDKTWKEIFKDLEWEVEVEITGESTEKEAVMTTLTTVLQTIATNPMILQDPNMKMLFNKILETTGAISPLELSASSTPTTSAVAQPNNPNPNANPQMGSDMSSLVGGDKKKLSIKK
jgi:hypothetical protein